VKLRGFRIELGEIEAVLLSQPGVEQAAVVAREEASGKRLVAYVAGTADVATLRAALAQRLPDYMVPQAFVVLERLPLSVNGKLDRRALPAPSSAASAPHVAPRTPTEETLARIFAEVLGRDEVGVEDNFFELGGDSLSATRVVARLQQEFSVGLPLKSLFERPVLADLGRHLETLKWISREGADTQQARELDLEEEGVL
jgi:acyl carrier protein